MIQKEEAGFTLVELMVVISMLAILSGLAIPNMMEWRRDAQLKNATTQLWNDLHKARYLAIKQNRTVRAQFSANRYYFIAIEDNSVLSSRNLPAGISIDLTNTTFNDDDADGNPDTSFNGRGVPVNSTAGDLGNVVIKGNADSRQININTIGRIQII